MSVVDVIGKNVTEILTLLGFTALVLAWRFPPLRQQGIMLMIAAAVAFIVSPYPAETKVYAYLGLDIAGGIYAYRLWRRYRDWTALGFLGLSLLCVIAHWALFWVHPENPNPWVGSLNAIYFAMCCMVGGAGYVRHNRHLFSKHWDYHPSASSHKGVG